MLGILKIAAATATVLAGAMVGEDQMDPARAADIRSLCEEEWPADFRMQAHCQTKQSTAYWRWLEAADLAEKARADAASTAYNKAFVVAFDGCTKEWWRQDNKLDFRMAVFCITKQMEAYDRLSKPQ